MKELTSWLVFFLCLPILGSCATAQLRPLADSPFAQTGLTAFPGERPEEILVRAHAGDVRAMALVVTGYHFGMEGFPHDERLAVEWLYQVFQLGAIRADGFLGTMVQADQPVTERIATKTAMCALGKESFFASIFKEAGIFDIEDRCRQLNAAPTADETTWSAQHQEKITYWRRVAEDHTAGITMMRELQSRSATQEEVHLLEITATDQFYLSRNLKWYIFYAATTHDIESESPDWSDARLMALTNKQNNALLPLRDSIEEAIILHATFEPSTALDIIRRAHAGDSHAMLTMARNYTAGEMGFPRSSGLSLYWFVRNKNSSMGTILAASRLYWNDDHPELVRKGIKWAEQFGDTPARAIANILREQLEKEADFDDTVKRQRPN
jgi:hypothetical protein